MTHDSSKPLVSRNVDAAMVAAESKSFADFDQWMDVQLELLVAQWIHTAAPNANRPQCLTGRFS
jgi:hypothetical protein